MLWQHLVTLNEKVRQMKNGCGYFLEYLKHRLVTDIMSKLSKVS